MSDTSRRGTSNANQRGNVTTRRQRRAWMLRTYRANVNALVLRVDDQVVDVLECPLEWELGSVTVEGYTVEMAARCYRCGRLLVDGTITADRIKRGADGGQYGTPLRDDREGRTNIRPACLPDNSETGAKGTRPSRARR